MVEGRGGSEKAKLYKGTATERRIRGYQGKKKGFGLKEAPGFLAMGGRRGRKTRRCILHG